MKAIALFAFPALAFAGLFGTNPTVTITPSAPSTPYTLRITLTATLKGKGANQGVMWTTTAGSITPIPGGNSASFMPPNACGVATVMAIAKSNTKATATAKVTVTADKVITIQPSSATIAVPRTPPANPTPQTLRFKAIGPCPASF